MGIKSFYEKKYKVLLGIPFIILLLAIGSIFQFQAETGDFVSKGISLKGGTSITILDVSDVSLVYDGEMNVRTISGTDTQGVIIELDTTDDAVLDDIKGQLNAKGIHQYNIETFGSSLGSNFFKEVVRSIIIAFVFMAIVVFIYFRSFMPSFAVVLAALSDIVITIAVVNILDIRLSTAGIAAFLMLIGYAVDTNILLSTKVLKKQDDAVMTRVYTAMKTGLAMSLTTITAIVVALIFSQNDVITQIMTILLIGLLVDLMNTWIQNVGLLRLHVEKNA